MPRAPLPTSFTTQPQRRDEPTGRFPSHTTYQNIQNGLALTSLYNVSSRSSPLSKAGRASAPCVLELFRHWFFSACRRKNNPLHTSKRTRSRMRFRTGSLFDSLGRKLPHSKREQLVLAVPSPGTQRRKTLATTSGTLLDLLQLAATCIRNAPHA